MLNKMNERELVYLVSIDNIYPIEGYDRVELATVGGWQVIVQKDKFKPGNLGIYFEVDSKVPNKEPFLFLESKKYKIKTLKMCKTVSQGLLMSPADFGWRVSKDNLETTDGNNIYSLNDESRFLTKRLGVTYADESDNKRKAKSQDKYTKMMMRRPHLFKKPLIKKIMKYKLGKKILFFLFGKKKDSQKAFPTKFPFVRKTDLERIENLPLVLKDKTPYIVTQKCDGSSATYILERKRRNKFEFYVCSRNVRQLKPSQKCYYDENYYWEVAKKYNIEKKMRDWLKKHPELDYVCWQGEICSPKIQGNPHKLTETAFFAFHFIDSQVGKWDILKAKEVWNTYSIPTVPIFSIHTLPDTMEEMKAEAECDYRPTVTEGQYNCKCEGLVYYKATDPNFYFKNVSKSYLLSKEK